jgi:hypothetical protein
MMDMAISFLNRCKKKKGRASKRRKQTNEIYESVCVLADSEGDEDEGENDN